MVEGAELVELETQVTAFLQPAHVTQQHSLLKVHQRPFGHTGWFSEGVGKAKAGEQPHHLPDEPASCTEHTHVHTHAHTRMHASSLVWRAFLEIEMQPRL